VVFVNSVRDGMNLVVQEGIVLSEHDPVVVLSRDTGAADALGRDALLVNPFDVSETANALHEALTMPDAERVARCRRLRKAAVALPPGPWFQAQLDAVNAQ
jgi:trehalose 6-phosphate synthase